MTDFCESTADKLWLYPLLHCPMHNSMTKLLDIHTVVVCDIPWYIVPAGIFNH